MSGVAIVRYLLAHNNGVIATVPVARIIAGPLPLKTTLPAISVTEISGVSRNTVAMNDPKVFVTERVQVTVVANSYASQKAILGLVRAALPLSRGTVNSFDCDSVIDDTEGPDIFDPELNLYIQTQDFFVRFNR